VLHVQYDLRVYVVVTCLNPLRVYLYEEGLVRFASERFSLHKSKLRWLPPPVHAAQTCQLMHTACRPLLLAACTSPINCKQGVCAVQHAHWLLVLFMLCQQLLLLCQREGSHVCM